METILVLAGIALVVWILAGLAALLGSVAFARAGNEFHRFLREQEEEMEPWRETPED